jgi:hypothetical protein
MLQSWGACRIDTVASPDLILLKSECAVRIRRCFRVRRRKPKTAHRPKLETVEQLSAQGLQLRDCLTVSLDLAPNQS